MRSRIARTAAVAAAAVTAVVATVTVAACRPTPGPARWVAPTAAPASAADASVVPSPQRQSPAPSASPSSGAPFACVSGTPWDCGQQRRFAAAEAYLGRKAGKIGVIVHDRSGGAVWRAGATTNTTWTASTIKLGIVAVILDWHRAGDITLDDTDRSNMSAALVDSANDATTALWSRYGGQPMVDRLRTVYGMSSLSVVPGYELFWRNLRCGAEDLHNLMLYVLDRLPADDRAYLVGKLRGVASNQRWGVWAAGSALRPGNKNGWAQKPDTGGTHWVTHTVGFAGAGERYVVVVTYSLPPAGTCDGGVQAVSDVVATIFGTPVPARISTP